MAGRDASGALPIVELLGVEAAMLTNREQTAEAPVVLVSLRPQPQRSWQSFSFPLSWEHAERLRDDLTNLLNEFRVQLPAN